MDTRTIGQRPAWQSRGLSDVKRKTRSAALEVGNAVHVVDLRMVSRMTPAQPTGETSSTKRRRTRRRGVSRRRRCEGAKTEALGTGRLGHDKILRSKHVVTTFLDDGARLFLQVAFFTISEAVGFAFGMSDGGKVVNDEVFEVKHYSHKGRLRSVTCVAVVAKVAQP